MAIIESEKKTVSISSKRQITIPQKFFQELGFGTEAECFIRGDEMVLRPVKAARGGDFAEQILTELIGQGLSGAELLQAFKERQELVKPAVGAMMSDAKSAAFGERKYKTVTDVFGEE